MFHAEQSETFRSDESLNNRYIGIINKVEGICREAGVDHRFVGGTVTDLLSPATRFGIDSINRTIRLQNFNPPKMIRGDGTVKDLDLIVFCPDRSKVQEVQDRFGAMLREADEARQPFPFVSLEGANYPGWPQRKKWKQFVTTFDADSFGRISLNFGKIHQPIDSKTVESWQVIAGDLKMTTLNPYAHMLCYFLRVPSGVKPKDKVKTPDGFSKIGLVGNLAAAVNNAGRVEGYNYKEGYQEWKDYITALLKHPDVLTRMKSGITGFWWGHEWLGTSIAHGRGPWSKLSRKSTIFTGN